jgi:hypothetical protein
MIPVAIIGIAAELPSGQDRIGNLDYHSFFEFLLNKGEAYEPIPAERFNIAASVAFRAHNPAELIS